MSAGIVTTSGVDLLNFRVPEFLAFTEPYEARAASAGSGVPKYRKFEPVF